MTFTLPYLPRRMALAIVLCLIAYGAGSIRTGFNGRDEYRYAHIAKEMDRPARYFVLHNQGALYLDKPPLYFWMARGAYALTGGVSPFGARLPLIVSTLLTVLLIADMARRLFNDRAAWLAALAYGLAFRPIWSAHNTKLDPPLILFFVAALWVWVLGRAWRQRGQRPPWTHAAAFWAALGLGFLVKGPLVFLAPAVIGVYLALRRRWMRAAGLSTLIGLAVFVGIVTVWVAPAWHYGGWDGYLGPMVEQEVLGRVVDPPQHVKQGVLNFYYYLAYFWGDFFPAALFLPGALWLAWRTRKQDARRDDALLFLAAWFFFIMVFFTLMRSKRSQYVLPAYPAAALMVGWFLDRALGGHCPRPGWLRVPMRIAGTLALLSGIAIWFDIPALRKEFHVSIPLGIKALASLVMLTGGAASLAGSRAGRERLGLAATLATIPTLLTLAHLLYFPLAYRDAPFQQFSKRMNAFLKPGEILLTEKRRQPQLSIWGHYSTYGLREMPGNRYLGFAPGDDPGSKALWRAFLADPRPLLAIVSNDEMAELREDLPEATFHIQWSGTLPIYSGEGGFHIVSNVPDYAKVRAGADISLRPDGS